LYQKSGKLGILRVFIFSFTKRSENASDKKQAINNGTTTGAQQKQWHSRAEGTKGGIRRSGDRRQTRSPRRGNPGRAKNQTQGTVEDSPPLFFLRANNNVFF